MRSRGGKSEEREGHSIALLSRKRLPVVKQEWGFGTQSILNGPF